MWHSFNSLYYFKSSHHSCFAVFAHLSWCLIGLPAAQAVLWVQKSNSHVFAEQCSECKLFNHTTAHDINCSVRFVNFHVRFPESKTTTLLLHGWLSCLFNLFIDGFVTVCITQGFIQRQIFYWFSRLSGIKFFIWIYFFDLLRVDITL